MELITWAISKGSDEPAHNRSLTRAFAVRIHVNTLTKLQAKTHIFSPNRRFEESLGPFFVCRLIFIFSIVIFRNTFSHYTKIEICPLAIQNQISTILMYTPRLVKIHWHLLKLSSGNENMDGQITLSKK